VALEDNITTKYETWSNRERVIEEHLRNFYNAQRGFGSIVAAQRFGSKSTRNMASWGEFYVDMLTALMQAEIKTYKLKSHVERKDGTASDNDYQKMYDVIVFVKQQMIASSVSETDDILETTLIDFADALFLIGTLYDKLGYSSPERKVVRSSLLSDVTVDGQDDDYEGEEILAF